jgi:hypothetical protein
LSTVEQSGVVLEAKDVKNYDKTSGNCVPSAKPVIADAKYIESLKEEADRCTRKKERLIT